MITMPLYEKSFINICIYSALKDPSDIFFVQS